MGEVFLAHNEFAQRDVAVKRVRRPPGAEGDEKIHAERTGAELERKLCNIDARVTKVYWFGEISGDLAVEMEYVEGRDLSAILADGPLPPGRAAVIALELCEMLENLRANGVVHGDLKPKNIRIDLAERIRVMDFGVAKALAETRDYTTALFGSTAYCSPERIELGTMDASSDLWSVGVILYQMLTGKLPFTGETPERLERRIRSGEPPQPLPSAVPESLRNICDRMLAHPPEARYASANAAHADLRLFLNGGTVAPSVVPGVGDATRRTTPPAYSPLDSDQTVRTKPPAPLPSPSIWPWLRRVAVLSIAVLFAIGVLLYMLIHPHYKAWADSRALKYEIETEHVNADAAWTRYREIVARKKIGAATWGISSPLKAKLVASGDVPILDFRNNDFPTAREGTWRRSQTYFSRALELDPGDKIVKGKLRLCEAHLGRITAGTRQPALNNAAELFRESADLMRKSPDPWIGMARLYAYNMTDPEHSQEALEHAARLGHAESRRELATLADAYARRAQQAIRDSAKFQNLPETEADALRRARADYDQARVLYSRLGSFSNSPNSLLAAIHGEEFIDTRIRELVR